MKKKVIKTSTIKFVAEDPSQQNFGKAKKATIPAASVSRTTTGYGGGQDQIDDLEEIKDQEVKVQRKLNVKRQEVEEVGEDLESMSLEA